MKKYVVLILSLVLITACKNTTTDSTNSKDTNTTPKPTTLADRAGTYEDNSNVIKVILNNDTKKITYYLSDSLMSTINYDPQSTITYIKLEESTAIEFTNTIGIAIYKNLLNNQDITLTKK